MPKQFKPKKQQPLTVSPNVQKILSKKLNPSSLIKEQPKRIFQGPTQNIVDIILQKPITLAKKDKPKNYKFRLCPDGRDCRKKLTCPYAHSQKDLRNKFIRRKKPCLLFQRGECQLGNNCRLYHGNMDLMKKYQYKANICQKYLNGECQLGKLCIHRHEKPQKLLVEGPYLEIVDIVHEQNLQQEQIEMPKQTEVRTQKEKQNQKLKPAPKINEIKHSGKQISTTQTITKIKQSQILQEGFHFQF